VLLYKKSSEKEKNYIMNELEQFKQTCKFVRNDAGIRVGALAQISSLWVACNHNSQFEVFDNKSDAKNYLTTPVTLN
jgi:hypothetical protein